MQLFLIAVTSWLDAVVACTNVLHPNEKSVMYCILTYAVVKVNKVYFVNINMKTMQFHTSRCLLEANRSFYE